MYIKVYQCAIDDVRACMWKQFVVFFCRSISIFILFFSFFLFMFLSISFEWYPTFAFIKYLISSHCESDYVKAVQGLYSIYTHPFYFYCIKWFILYTISHLFDVERKKKKQKQKNNDDEVDSLDIYIISFLFFSLHLQDSWTTRDHQNGYLLVFDYYKLYINI